MPPHRPPEFTTRHCDGAIECMARGHTIAAFAGEIGVPRATVMQWAREHPEFADALKVGQAKAVAFWEGTLADIAKTGKGNATAAIFALKTYAPDEDLAKLTGSEIPEFSDLELARHIAHILLEAEQPEGEDT
jgi:hypothetical protein